MERYVASYELRDLAEKKRPTRLGSSRSPGESPWTLGRPLAVDRRAR